MERYSQMSKQVMEILKSFSSDVQQISIDEAFLDMMEPFVSSGFQGKRESSSRRR
jgi:DNA polymerase-4